MTNSSGVQKLGPDTYRVSSDDRNPSVATKASLQAANAHCTSLGREIVVTNQVDTPQNLRSVSDVTFMCLGKGDPQLARPQYERAPQIRIEDVRKK